ncbi:MAG: hypothetical protein IPH28_08505 [Cytophagaceae bacterium]|nr:hypothetical protein [Cytophagaceae bacterium]
MYLPILIFETIVGANVTISVYLERKLSAFIQEVGANGSWYSYCSLSTT